MLKKLAILIAAASLATPALARDNWLSQAQEINKIQIGKRDPGARRMMIKSGTTPANRTVSYPVRLEAGKTAKKSRASPKLKTARQCSACVPTAPVNTN